MLVSKAIPHLVNGVSQQPPGLRLLSQAEDQVSCYSSVVEGLKKRPPTYHVARVISGELADAFLHTINRDTEERYKVVITEGRIRVYDLDGTSKAVIADDSDLQLLPAVAAVTDGATFDIHPAASPTSLQDETELDFTVTITGTATCKLQGSTNGSSWSDLATRTSSGTNTAVAWGSNVYIRAIVSAYTSGTVKAKATYRRFPDYIDTATPSSNVAATTIADYTVVVNKQKEIKRHFQGSRWQVDVNSNTVNTVYRVYVDMPEGTIGSDNTTEWGSPFDVQHKVTAGQTTTQIATALNTLLLAEPNDNLFIVTLVSTNHLIIGGLRKTTGVNIPFEVRLYVNGVEVEPKETDDEADASNSGELFRDFRSTVALFFVKQGNYGTKYTVQAEQIEDSGTFFTANYTTDNTNVLTIDTRFIATTLHTTLNAVGTFTDYYTATVSGSLIKIIRIDGSNFKILTADGNGNRNLVGIKDTIQKFADLPANSFAEVPVKVIGDSAAEEDDYYVRFEAIEPTGTSASEGVWREVAQPGGAHRYRTDTMPHTLVRQSDGTFLFGPQDWLDRVAGDDESNPPASFTGGTIKDIFFFRNRLGFLTDDNVVLSCAGDYFNFWRNTVTAILDGDVIDVAASSTEVALLRHAIPFAKKLIIFSDQQQFVMDPGDLLTPKTVAIKPSTKFEALTAAKPVLSGKAIYFAFPRGEEGENAFVGVREYAVDTKTTDEDDALDITAHVPSYIPGGVFRIFTATNEQILGLLTTGASSKIFLYKWFITPDGDKLQSAWSEWDFGEDAEILDAAFINLDLWMLVQRSDGVYLEKLSVGADRRDEDMDYEVLLDRKLSAASNVAYNSTTRLTTWTLPYAETEDLVVVTRPGGAIAEEYQLKTEQPTSNTITAEGNYSAQPVYIGRPYTSEYEFSQAIVKEKSSSGGDGAPIIGGRLQVGTYTLSFDRTGYFRVEVTPRGQDTYTYKFTGKTLGAELEIGANALWNGTFRVPVRSKADRVSVKIVSDSWRPFRIQAAEWEGQFTNRSKRF